MAIETVWVNETAPYIDNMDEDTMNWRVENFPTRWVVAGPGKVRHETHGRYEIWNRRGRR